MADDSNEGTPPESDGQALAENEGTENTQVRKYRSLCVE